MRQGAPPGALSGRHLDSARQLTFSERASAPPMSCKSHFHLRTFFFSIWYIFASTRAPSAAPAGGASAPGCVGPPEGPKSALLTISMEGVGGEAPRQHEQSNRRRKLRRGTDETSVWADLTGGCASGDPVVMREDLMEERRFIGGCGGAGAAGSTSWTVESKVASSTAAIH